MTEIDLASRSIVTLKVSMLGSLICARATGGRSRLRQLGASTAQKEEQRTLLSAALTRISSKILKKPGTNVICLEVEGRARCAAAPGISLLPATTPPSTRRGRRTG